VGDPHEVEPGPDAVDGQVERDGDHVDDAAGEDHASAPVPVDAPADRRPERDARDGDQRRDEADLELVRPEPLQEARKVQEQIEGERLQEVRDEAQREGQRQQPGPGHRPMLPGAPADAARRAGLRRAVPHGRRDAASSKSPAAACSRPAKRASRVWPRAKRA
jgi:hypothetical protein